MIPNTTLKGPSPSGWKRRLLPIIHHHLPLSHQESRRNHSPSASPGWFCSPTVGTRWNRKCSGPNTEAMRYVFIVRLWDVSELSFFLSFAAGGDGSWCRRGFSFSSSCSFRRKNHPHRKKNEEDDDLFFSISSFLSRVWCVFLSIVFILRWRALLVTGEINTQKVSRKERCGEKTTTFAESGRWTFFIDLPSKLTF